MRLKHACIAIAICGTPDLLLKHPYATLATYKKKIDEILKTCVYNTCKKTPEKHLKTIVKYTQHPDKTRATYI
jgi:hypothetical protein